MKNLKVAIMISLIACLIIGILIIGVWKMGWVHPSPEEAPDGRIEMDKNMKESIFNQMSENYQGDPAPFVTVNGNGQKIYDWQNIETLLHRSPEDMEIADYKSLFQIVQNMTAIQADDSVAIDFEAMGQLIQRGYKGAYLTSTMTNLCILYKEWVETFVLVSPQTSVLFLGSDTEKKNLEEHFKQEMLKAAMLDGILMNDNEIIQSKNSVLQGAPEINIIYQEKDKKFDNHYLIQIGNKTIAVYPAQRTLSYTIDDLKLSIAKSPSLSATEKHSKFENAHILNRIVQAYRISSVLAVSDNFDMQIVACFDGTELEIRVHAYGADMYKEKGDPEYLDLTASDLQVQYASGNMDQINEYLKWWGEQTRSSSYDDHKGALRKVCRNYFDNNPQILSKELEELTPAQIIELNKKLRDPDYELNLSNDS